MISSDDNCVADGGSSDRPSSYPDDEAAEIRWSEVRLLPPPIDNEINSELDNNTLNEERVSKNGAVQVLP